MKTNNNEIIFSKRIDIWREYRDEINMEALHSANLINVEKEKIAKLVNKINAIDPSILSGHDTQSFVLSKGSTPNINFSDEYKKLSFVIGNLDSNLLNQINNLIDDATAAKKDNSTIDDNGNISLNNLNEGNDYKKFFNDINNEINLMSNVIQYFPETSKKHLVILDESLMIAKKNQNDPLPKELKVDANKVNNSKNLKLPYIISLCVIVFALLVIIILIILIIIKW